MSSTFPVTIEERVRWGEMDAFAHLNNVHYFRLFENVRIKYFDLAGILTPQLRMGAGPILAETSCRFRAPVTYPDNLSVSARTIKIYETGMFHVYEIKTGQGIVAATGEARIVVYDYAAGKISPVTDEMLTAVSRLERREFVIESR